MILSEELVVQTGEAESGTQHVCQSLGVGVYSHSVREAKVGGSVSPSHKNSPYLKKNGGLFLRNDIQN